MDDPLEFGKFEVAPLHLDAATIMDLQGDAALCGTDLGVVDIDHRFAIEPRLNVVALNAQAQRVPVALLEDRFFSSGICTSQPRP